MTNASTPTLSDYDMTSWYDAAKTYCLIEVESNAAAILNCSENERFIALIPPIVEPEEELKENPQTGLALTFGIDTFTDVVEGHSFGTDPEQCDILLAEQHHDLEELHFRFQLDYAQKRPELDIVNCSSHGISVDNKLLATVGEKIRLCQGEVVQIVTGDVALRLWFPYLDFTNRKMLSRWDELRMTAISLMPPSVRHARLPKDIRQRYLDARVECIWQDARLSNHQVIYSAQGKPRPKVATAVVLKKLRDSKGDARDERINHLETEAMTRIRHENLVSALRETWPQGNVILVEHTPHGSISDFIRQHNGIRLKEDAVMDLALQTLHGLSHLNSQNMPHRDVKPSKILVFRTDPPLFKLTDFGGHDYTDIHHYLSSRIADDTIDYIAPEVFESGSHSPAPKSDVWSLGIVMWELLVGTSPIPFVEVMDYLSCFRAILNWQPRGRELADCGVSDEGQEVLLRMVERNVKFRPDVEALRADECFDYLEGVRLSEPCDLQNCVL